MGKAKRPSIQLSFGESVPGIKRIDEDLIIFENISEIMLSDYPVRVDIVILALCLEGKTRTMVNLKEFEMVPNTMLIATPDQILQQIERSPDFSGILIGVSRKLINELTPSVQEILPTLLYIQENPLTHINEEEVNLIQRYYDFLSDRVKYKDNKYHLRLTYHLMAALFYDAFNMVFKHHQNTNLSKNRQEKLFESFMLLVNKHFVQQRVVSFYADQLGITSKYLSQTIKSITGKTAGEWIDLYVILEAKVLLRSSTDNIQQISEQLNFSNQSFFGKYFKQHTGYSPKNYRKTRKK